MQTEKRMLGDLSEIYNNCDSYPSKYQRVSPSGMEHSDISDEDMEDVHFIKFDRVPYMNNETNCMYLARILQVEHIAIPLVYLARGMENVVFKAIGVGHHTGKELIIRVSRFGDEDYDTTYAWSRNSCRVQRDMYGRFEDSKLEESGFISIPVPDVVYRTDATIGCTTASVQVVEYVKGITLEEAFKNANKIERQKLIHMYGNTLGHLHWNSEVIHGDYHATNVMVSTPNHDKFLTIIDMDRSIDYSRGSIPDNDMLAVCMDYDLTQALSSIFKMIAIRFRNEKRYKKIKEKLFKIFMRAYGSNCPAEYNWDNSWEDVLHIDETTPTDEYMDVLQEGFYGYDDIFNRIIGV